MEESKKSEFKKRIKNRYGSMFSKKQRQRPFALSVLFTTLKIMAVIVVMLGAAGMGLVFGIAKAYVDTTPMLDLSALTDSSRTSYIYDSKGELITTYTGAEYREWANIDEIPTMLQNAVISIEDVRFTKHSGLDYKRLISAVINTFRNQDTHGGSTITQQLIKNTILTNVQSYKRKIQEAYLALELEQVSDKDSILEAYLNQVYLGDSNYGVKSAAKDYFGKELNELTIRECAMLAGMIQKPNGYNPRLNTYKRIDEETGENQMKRTDDRTDLVINAMYDAGYITMDQRDNALTEKVSIVETSTKTAIYDKAYFVEYAVVDIIDHMIEQRGLANTQQNRNAIETELRTGGYHIYLTVDSDIQEIVEQTTYNYDDYPELKNPSAAERVDILEDGSEVRIIEPQAAAVVMDHNTGNIVAIVGGRTEPTTRKAWNRAYMSALEVGSSIKPIAVYGPALDLGFSPATIEYNLAAPVTGWNTSTGYPSLGASQEDFVTLRRGVRSSLNVVAARTLMDKVGIETSRDYLIKLGIDRENINADGPGLALGTTGITPIQMAAAYSTIANNGVYNEPMSFTQVKDSEGRVILDAEQIRDSHRVFKESTAWLLTSMMEDVVDHGTGTRAKIRGMTVAGKTGTNSDYSSVCFTGMTGYYTATVWIGHDYPENKLAHNAGGGRYAAPYWQEFMAKIHEGLDDIPITDVDPDSLNLRRRTVCSVSGLLATDACHNDPNHPPVTDWFDRDNIPEKSCDMHVTLNACAVTGSVASPNCPSTTQKSFILISSTSPLMQFDAEKLKSVLGNCLIYTDLTIDEYVKQAGNCSLHGGGGGGTQPDNPDDEPSDSFEQLIERARNVISEVQASFETYDYTDEQESVLKRMISYVEMAIEAGSESGTEYFLGQLERYYEQFRS